MREITLLRDTEKIFRPFVEAAPVAILLSDETGKIVFLNAAAEKLYGYENEELFGKPVEVLIPERFRNTHVENRQKHVQNGHTRGMGTDINIWALCKDGTEFPADISLKHITINNQKFTICFIIDIRKHKQLEDALRNSEARYRRLFEDDLTGNFVIDPFGQITMCNLSFAKIFGFATKHDVYGKNFFDFFSDPEIRRQFIENITKHGKIALQELRLQRRDEKIIYVLANIVGRFDKNGHLTAIRGFLSDITRRQEIESQLMQAQKMESLGILAGSIAHDFNNIITVIKGYTDILLTNLKVDDPQRKNVEKIQQANKQAMLLIRQIQAFSHKQEIQPQVIDINVAIMNISEMLQRLISKKIRLKFNLARQISNVMIDIVQVEQVIMNLVVNARDAMLPAGGDLTINTLNAELNAQQLMGHEDVKPGKYVMLSVKDTGIGMDPQTKARIFEPFFTTKPRDKGTGLGLSTVYGIVKQNTGHIEVETAAGEGTTFNIYFPAVEHV